MPVYLMIRCLYLLLVKSSIYLFLQILFQFFTVTNYPVADLRQIKYITDQLHIEKSTNHQNFNQCYTLLIVATTSYNVAHTVKTLSKSLLGTYDSHMSSQNSCY